MRLQDLVEYRVLPLKTPHSRGGSSHGRQWPIESDVNGLPSQPLGIDRSAGRITCGANKAGLGHYDSEPVVDGDYKVCLMSGGGSSGINLAQVR